MAFGVLQALRESENSIEYDVLATKTHAANGIPNSTAVEIFCCGKPVNVYLAEDTSVPDAIDQAVWAMGFKHKEDYALFEELPRKGYILIGNEINLLSVSAGKKCDLVLRKKFSRLTEEEKEDASVTNTAYVLAQERYKKGRYNHDDKIATQLGLLQILAGDKADLLNNRNALSQRISAYFPQEVSQRTLLFLNVNIRYLEGKNQTRGRRK